MYIFVRSEVTSQGMHCVRVPAMKRGTEWAFEGHREQDSSVVMYYGRHNVRILCWLLAVLIVLAVGCVVLTVLAVGFVDCVACWLC
jgi:hypothetical protein